MEKFTEFLGIEFMSRGAMVQGERRYFDVGHLRRPEQEDFIAAGGFRTVMQSLERQRGVHSAPLFVSYYTPATPYEALADQLRRSLDRHGLEHRIEPITSLGSWVANTGLKASFIERAWQESDRPICWVDADAELLRAPQFLYGNPFDFALVRRHGWYFMSGLVYFGKNTVAGELVARWAMLCRQYPHVWDQVLLTLAWYQVAQRHPVNTMYLPDGIFRFPRPFLRDLRDRVFFYPTGRKMRPFFDQKQASRAHKRFIDASAKRADEKGSDDLSADFRQSLIDYDFERTFGIETLFNSSA